MARRIKIALVGNPNTGKSTLFNLLTGLNQKIGNFPGITVDKKIGQCKLAQDIHAEVIDLPGTYSLYPKSKDESIVFQVLANSEEVNYPDLVVLVVDATNLRRNLLLFTQVADLGLPIILALNMTDIAQKEGIDLDVDLLSQRLGVQIVSISARNNLGLEELKSAIVNSNSILTQQESVEVSLFAPKAIAAVKEKLNCKQDYVALQILHQYESLNNLSPSDKQAVSDIVLLTQFDTNEIQTKETIARYRYLSGALLGVTKDTSANKKFALSDKIDTIVTHKIFGFAIFFFILFFVFNAIFTWASYPMEWIENAFLAISNFGHEHLPAGVMTNLVLDGVLSGLGGIFVFIPQIAILFAFISVLEDTGYMARVTFMLDKVMRKFGLSGKSVVPIIGAFACAVPSIMSARNIENWKDKIITIMVTPLISCSARLPVYILLISMVVPKTLYFGFLSLQSITLMAMYLISILAAILVAMVMKFFIKVKEKSYFIMELPVYRMPRWSNVFYTMYEKSKTFVLEAGKVIIAISVVLWVMATYGPTQKFTAIEQKYEQLKTKNPQAKIELERSEAAEKLENSYAGILGKSIEPMIKPLGFDWKIGIALITSFAARETFVATMATIYSVDAEEGESETLRVKMSKAMNPETGLPVFTFATAFSLMLFYAFAMQCMSTIAVVYRETKTWKWPMIQLVYMTALAYAASFIAYHCFK
ncbi:MAG: ferrous iron transport protein B [Sphingobacteriaceae bacterium]|nr:ferrous iron transport protein B [Sphingobacteriaceae bacterium]